MIQMSLKRTLGLAGFDISDEEIMLKLASAHQLGKEFIEFVSAGNVVRLHVHGCETTRDFDASDRAWFAS